MDEAARSLRNGSRIARPRAEGQDIPKVPERRRARRSNVRCECWLQSDAESVYSAEADVDRDRLFLRTAVPVQMGESVEVSLRLRGQEDTDIEARGVITCIVDNARGQRAAVGVELSEIVTGEHALQHRLRS